MYILTHTQNRQEEINTNTQGRSFKRKIWKNG